MFGSRTPGNKCYSDPQGCSQEHHCPADESAGAKGLPPLHLLSEVDPCSFRADGVSRSSREPSNRDTDSSKSGHNSRLSSCDEARTVIGQREHHTHSDHQEGDRICRLQEVLTFEVVLQSVHSDDCPHAEGNKCLSEPLIYPRLPRRMES